MSTCPNWSETDDGYGCVDDAGRAVADCGFGHFSDEVCREHATLIRRAVNAYEPLVAVRDAAQTLADYYAKSVNVGPGPNPSREVLLWASLRQALKDIGEGTPEGMKDAY